MYGAKNNYFPQSLFISFLYYFQNPFILLFNLSYIPLHVEDIYLSNIPFSEAINMEKVFKVLTFLFPALMIFPLNTLSATSPTTHCRSIINDMVVECLPYFVDRNNSQPHNSCCFSVQYVVATASGCICDFIMDMEVLNLPLYVTKTVNLSTVCGASFPCQCK